MMVMTAKPVNVPLTARLLVVDRHHLKQMSPNGNSNTNSSNSIIVIVIRVRKEKK